MPWYSTITIAPDLVKITEPHVHRMLRSNIWWIRGQRDIVIDAGLGIVPLRSSIPQMFERDPLLIVSHSHLDHSGGAYEFDDVAIHEDEADALEGPPQTSLETVELYASLGVPVDDETHNLQMLQQLPHPHYRLDEYRLRPARSTRQLKDGDIIQTAESELEVISAPGHSPGSICLLDRAKRRVYTGDAIYKGQILDGIRGSNRPDYVRTMRKIQDLDVDQVLPGHGDVLDRRQMREIAANYISRQETVERAPLTAN